MNGDKLFHFNKEAEPSISLIDGLMTVPLTHDETQLLVRADAFIAEWSLEEVADAIGREAFRHLCASLLSHSPYLAHIVRRHGDWVARIAQGNLKDHLEGLIGRTVALRDLPEQAEIMKGLRLAKLEAALLIGLADLAGIWSLESVTEGLSAFADATVQAALGWAFDKMATSGAILALAADGEAEQSPRLEDSGITVLGMGKYGACELNYSSDIDIVVFFEPGMLRYSPDHDERDVLVKITQKIVKLLQERTEDGYVFRVDLRLRPDPGSTAVAVSLPAAEQYYESRGQNWERAAFIKARAVAGDPETGKHFLSFIAPFIWRRNLDFAAIDDIHSMKRQIHAVGGHGVIAVAGHNIKLGRGGIREIEFFVQTQQLIAGGRDGSLREPRTLTMLDRLCEENWITAEARDELKASYRFLRTLEHRLQMVDDEQTHSLPSSPEKLEAIASFMGYREYQMFEDDVRQVLSNVQKHYVALFETAPPLDEEKGSLVFTGTEDDPETLETLSQLGFVQTKDISAIVREWHSGRMAATRSPRSREMLTALMPTLLRALSRTASPDTAFARFDSFLRGLPAGVQLFSLLYANPHLLGLIADICGTAPRLADYLSKSPAVLDAVLDPHFFSVLPDRETLRNSLSSMMERAEDFQDQLDFARIWAREYRFRLGVRVLSASADAREAGAGFAEIADILITELAKVAEERVAERHGKPEKVAYSVVAMGKLGGREMSTYSDLDLIMIYDVGEGMDLTTDMTDGKRPISIPQFYTKLCQQLISALTVPTAEGALYEVDMRLRPSGNAGPLATSLSSFKEYQKTGAWTWEHMALTRARVVTGPPELENGIGAVIEETLCRPRDPEALRADVADMRGRLAREFSTVNPWDLKQVRGGLVDIEFITQYLQLLHGGERPDILHQQTVVALERIAEAGLIGEQDGAVLIKAARLQSELTQITRLCLSKPLDPYRATGGLKALLARATDMPDFDRLNLELSHCQSEVFRVFEKLIGPPPKERE